MSAVPSTAELPREPFHLDFRPRRRNTDQEELAFYRATYRATPESIAIRFNLTALLNALSQFEESAALLKAWAIDDFPFLVLAIRAYLGLGTPASVEQARVLCLHALEICRNDADGAAIRHLLADCLLRQNDYPGARAELLAALETTGYRHHPYTFLLRSEINRGHAAAIAAYADRWLATGPPTAGIIASQILAQAQLGHIEQALETQGLDRFLRQYEPAPPAGWDTLADFNQALAHEIANHPSLRENVEGASSRKTRHVPQPDLERSHVYHQFQQMIRREIAAYYAALPGESDHAFLRMRQPSGVLQNWCVLTEGEGHETWHQHPGWLSGTYYVQVPDHIAHGAGKAGCIAFGLPDGCATLEDTRRFGEVLCRPRAGLLVLFPSYVHHKTYPHRGPGLRICCAFDVQIAHESTD